MYFDIVKNRVSYLVLFNVTILSIYFFSCIIFMIDLHRIISSISVHKSTVVELEYGLFSLSIQTTDLAYYINNNPSIYILLIILANILFLLVDRKVKKDTSIDARK